MDVIKFFATNEKKKKKKEELGAFLQTIVTYSHKVVGFIPTKSIIAIGNAYNPVQVFELWSPILIIVTTRAPPKS